MNRLCKGFVGFVCLVLACGTTLAGGGDVLPAAARPGGASLTDMAGALAFFSTSGNDLQYYPQTPFQILYVDRSTQNFDIIEDGGETGILITGTNSFTVRPGTSFFVPVAYVDDSPPIVGNFPQNASAAPQYIYGRDQVGLEDTQIVVDGQATGIGSDYVAGPVTTAPLPDGGGTHFIQVGAFLTALSPGTHTVVLRGRFSGAALVPFLDPFDFQAFELTYTVIVR